MTNILAITCIYKITSPSGKVYIGQTVNAKRRYLDYKSKEAKKQPRLWNSIKKYSWQAHAFKIIHELPNDVSQETLNVYECFYMELYKSSGTTLLNTKEGGSNGRNSDDSIKKANDKWKAWYKDNPQFLNNWVQASVDARKGIGLTQEHKEKIKNKLKGRVFTAEHLQKISKALKSKPRVISDKQRKAARENALLVAGKNKRAIVQYSLDGAMIKEWESATLAADSIGVSRKGIERCLKKKRGGKTFAGHIWRYKDDESVFDISFYKHNNSPEKKPVVQCTLIGEFVNEWPSMTTAGNVLRIPVMSISRCVRDQQKSAGGFTWRYK